MSQPVVTTVISGYGLVLIWPKTWFATTGPMNGAMGAVGTAHLVLPLVVSSRLIVAESPDGAVVTKRACPCARSTDTRYSYGRLHSRVPVPRFTEVITDGPNWSELAAT